MKKALQEAAGKVQSRIAACVELRNKQVNTRGVAHYNGQIAELNAALTIIRDLLPTEKQQLEDAWGDGWKKGNSGIIHSPEQYYSKTYNNE